MLRAPFQESLVSYWLTLGTLPLVVRAYGFAEVLGVGEIEGNVGGVEPLSKISNLSFKDVQNNPEVTGNSD
jgi:hypothetical protein